jgi:hypothetical protein
MKFVDVETITPAIFACSGREIAFVDALFIQAQKPSPGKYRVIELTRQYYSDIELLRSSELKAKSDGTANPTRNR